MMIFQGNFGRFYSRKLMGLEAVASSPAPTPYTVNKSFDANVVMVLSVLLCALVCSLCLNSIIRCVLRCSTLVHSDPMITPPPRLPNTGLQKKALKAFLTVRYREGMKLDKECVICLSEFLSEERVKILPKCNHGFHVRCIDKWLTSHSSCPTCRHSLIETCQKILSGGACRNVTPPQSHEQHVVSVTSNISIMPLQHEPFVQSNEI